MEKVAQSLGELTEAFLLSKQVSGCTGATLVAYRQWLLLFHQEVGETVDASPCAGSLPSCKNVASRTAAYTKPIEA